MFTRLLLPQVIEKQGHCRVQTLQEAQKLYDGQSVGALTYVIGYTGMDETTRAEVRSTLQRVVAKSKADYLSKNLGNDAIYGGQVRRVRGIAACACPGAVWTHGPPGLPLMACAGA